MSTRILSGTVRHSDGTAWGHATLRVQKLALGTQPGEVYPMDGFNVTADANGVLPETALAVPETGAWLRRITFPDTTEIDFYLAAGAPISIDEIVALAEEAGSEAGTPQGEMLNGLYTAVSGAADGQLLETDGGNLTPTEQPRGYWMQRTAVPEGSLVTIPIGHQMVVVGNIDVAGDLIVEGTLITGDDVDNYDPAGTAAAVQTALQDALAVHTGDLANPHQVTAAQAGAAALRPSVNEQAVPYYIFATSDEGKIVASLSATPVTFIMNNNANTPFPVGAIIGLEQQGAGSLTIAGVVGVTVNSLDGSLTLAGQWACAVLRKIAADTWILAGALA